MKRELITLHSDSRFLSVSEQQKSYDEIVDLFARGASSAEVLAFRPSQELGIVCDFSLNGTLLKN